MNDTDSFWKVTLGSDHVVVNNMTDRKKTYINTFSCKFEIIKYIIKFDFSERQRNWKMSILENQQKRHVLQIGRVRGDTDGTQSRK